MIRFADVLHDYTLIPWEILSGSAKHSSCLLSRQYDGRRLPCENAPSEGYRSLGPDAQSSAGAGALSRGRGWRRVGALIGCGHLNIRRESAQGQRATRD